MAKTTKRWAVRESKAKGGWYLIVIGPKPSKPKDGWYELVEEGAADVDSISSDLFEWIFPDCYHLPFGGGPVEIRFADE